MPAPELEQEDREALEKLARRIVELKLETPALLTLETTKPLSVLAGQAMLFFEPFAQALFRFQDYRRVAALVERRDALEALARMIEKATDDRENTARAAKAAARDAKTATPAASAAAGDDPKHEETSRT